MYIVKSVNLKSKHKIELNLLKYYQVQLPLIVTFLLS